MQKRIQQILSTTVITFGLAGPVLSQPVTAGTAGSGHTEPAQTYSDTQLKNFISASRKIVAISQEYAPKIESSANDSERERMFREADQKMVTAVRQEGLSVDEFNAINHQIPHDPRLEERVSKLLQ